MEEWRDIKGFEGQYQVSNHGRVRSLKYGKERVLSAGCKSKGGYLLVCLCKNGKGKMCLIHRLVAEAFIPNPYNLPQVNHINEDKQSNVVTNLEWCDAAYNTNYGTGHQRSAEKKSVRVYQYTISGEFVRSYPSLHEAERQTGIDHSRISDCCNSKRKSTGGYRWSFNPPTPSITRALF